MCGVGEAGEVMPWGVKSMQGTSFQTGRNRQNSEANCRDFRLLPEDVQVHTLPLIPVWDHKRSCFFSLESIFHAPTLTPGFPGISVVKNPLAITRDAGSIPKSGRSPAGGNGYPLQ